MFIVILKSKNQNCSNLENFLIGQTMTLLSYVEPFQLIYIFSSVCNISGWCSSDKQNRKELYMRESLIFIHFSFNYHYNFKKVFLFIESLYFKRYSLQVSQHIQELKGEIFSNVFLTLDAMLIQCQLVSDPFLGPPYSAWHSRGPDIRFHWLQFQLAFNLF